MLETPKTTLGPDHDDTLLSMNNLGFCYHGLGQYEKCLALHEEAHRRRLAKHGEDHPDTVASLDNVATSLMELGAIPRGTPLIKKSAELHRKRMGTDHPDTWECLDQLSCPYQAVGETARAIQLGEEVLNSLAKLAANHPDTFQSMNNLASIYFGAGQFQRCLELHDRALDGRRAKLSAQSTEHTIVSMYNVATAHMAFQRAPIARCHCFRRRRS